MRLTWSSAHTAMTEDMRELMKKFNEATPLQLASQLQDIRQSLNPPPSSNIQVEGKNEQESQGRPRLPSGFDGKPNASMDTRLRDPSPPGVQQGQVIHAPSARREVSAEKPVGRGLYSAWMPGQASGQVPPDQPARFTVQPMTPKSMPNSARSTLSPRDYHPHSLLSFEAFGSAKSTSSLASASAMASYQPSTNANSTVKYEMPESLRSGNAVQRPSRSPEPSRPQGLGLHQSIQQLQNVRLSLDVQPTLERAWSGSSRARVVSLGRSPRHSGTPASPSGPPPGLIVGQERPRSPQAVIRV